MPDLNDLLIGIHRSWHHILKESLSEMNEKYLQFLSDDKDFFPNKKNFLNAFKTLSLDETIYILFGQEPYPRRESALGYSFIDGRVKRIFSEKGFSKEVNKATSLRNFLKMLLVADEVLKEDDTTQKAISAIDRSRYCDSVEKLRVNFEKSGVLLLNTALVYTSENDKRVHIKEWRTFIRKFLSLVKDRDITLILFGKVAQNIESFEESKDFKKIILPHPYNLDFIKSKEAQRLFAPMKLLSNLPL